MLNRVITVESMIEKVLRTVIVSLVCYTMLCVLLELGDRIWVGIFNSSTFGKVVLVSMIVWIIVRIYRLVNFYVEGLLDRFFGGQMMGRLQRRILERMGYFGKGV